MKKRWLLVAMLAVVASCRDCGVCGKGVSTDAELLGMKRIGPCTYEYYGPVAWWRYGFIAVEVNDLAIPLYKVDTEKKQVSFPCGRYDAGEPTDVRIVYIYG